MRAVALAVLCACAVRAEHTLTDEQYYSMPQLFHLDDYDGCLATHNVYCLGSFELTTDDSHHQLYKMMKKYSDNWVDNFNHTRLHRGWCISRRCPKISDKNHALDTWFSTCVNESTTAEYNLSARLYQLDYCKQKVDAPSGTASETAFASFVAALLALAVVCTVMDKTLSDYARKNAQWALTWSIPGCWKALTTSPQISSDTDLRAFDGLRVVCMMCVIIEHVVWLSTLSYVGATRYTELTRRASDVMLMTNSTLVVQIFFMMSSFLLAHKLLQQRRRQQRVPPFTTFVQTMVNRIIRLSPSYFVVVWFAASSWEHQGKGPMWTPLVETEAAICRRKWWTHLLYLNNVVYPDDKCLIQTWYLAADMQLYAVCLILTLVLWRWRRGALYILTALLISSIALLFGFAYAWNLMPTFVLHRPELIRSTYSGEPSFNVLYQSPLGNMPGALTGLLLAHAHHALLDARINLNDYKWFRWLSVASTPIGIWWAAMSPLLLGNGIPGRGAAAALAALERPVFAFFTGLALIGAMHDIKSPWRRWMSWSGWSTLARLSFGALLLHMPLNKTLIASRIAMTQIGRQTAITHWFGVAAMSYLLAIPLALLVELPAQRLHKYLTTRKHAAKPVPTADDHNNNTKSNM